MSEENIHAMDGDTSASDMLAGRAEGHENKTRGKWAKLFNNLSRPFTAPYRGLKYIYNNPVTGTAKVAAVIGGGVGIAVAKAHFIDRIPMESMNWENLGHLAVNFGPTFAIATGVGGFLGYMVGRMSNMAFDENFQHYSTRKAGKYIGAFLAAWLAFNGHDHGKDYSQVYLDATVNAPETMQNIADAQHDFWFPSRVNTVTDPKWEIEDQPNCLYQDLIQPDREYKCKTPPAAEGMTLTVPGLNAPPVQQPTGPAPVPAGP